MCRYVCSRLCVCRQIQAEGLDALSGVTLGPRLLLGLAAAVECVAGPEAAAKLNVIIHCSESQVCMYVYVSMCVSMCLCVQVYVHSLQREPGVYARMLHACMHVCILADRREQCSTFLAKDQWPILGTCVCMRACMCWCMCDIVCVYASHSFQEFSVINDLISRHHCGLKPGNVFVVLQQARHGYVWDNDEQTFVSTRDK